MLIFSSVKTLRRCKSKERQLTFSLTFNGSRSQWSIRIANVEINIFNEKIGLIDLDSDGGKLISDMSSLFPMHLEDLIKRALMEGVNIDKHDIKQTPTATQKYVCYGILFTAVDLANDNLNTS